MDLRESEQKYVKDLFEVLLKITMSFELSETEGEPKGATREELLRFRLISLIRSVRLMAIRQCRRMPRVFRTAKDEDDWIQEAFEILYFQSLDYKPKLGYFYDSYMKWKVLNGLISKQRSLYRKNPADDEMLSKIVSAMKREVRREVTAREIAEFAGVGIEEAQRVLDRGAGARMFVEWTDTMDLEALEEDDEPRPGSSPEKACLRKEFRRIFLECIERLQPLQRFIVIQRYLEQRSLGDIARRVCKEIEAVRSQARRGFDAVRDCVAKRYKVKITVPA